MEWEESLFFVDTVPSGIGFVKVGKFCEGWKKDEGDYLLLR